MPGLSGRLVVSEIAAASGYPDLGPDGRLRCQACSQEYPIVGGTPRMLESTALSELLREYPRSSHVLGERASDQDRPPPDPQASVKQRTADSFAYEWSHFGQSRSEWDRNFRDYLQPHSPESLRVERSSTSARAQAGTAGKRPSTALGSWRSTSAVQSTWRGSICHLTCSRSRQTPNGSHSSEAPSTSQCPSACCTTCPTPCAGSVSSSG